MPELPEAETIVAELRPRILGCRIDRAQLRKSDVLRQISKAALLRGLHGASIVDITRRAKHLVIELDTDRRLIIQLGMTGSLVSYDPPLERDQRRYAVLILTLDDDRLLVFRDMRRFGTVWLLDEAGWQQYTSRLGPEPLDPTFTVERLRAQLASTRQAIKKALMDQRRIAGVGNIYANEILFEAGVDPRRPANRIGAAPAKRLHHALRNVLASAIRARGTTIRDYRTGTGQHGQFQFSLKVYGRGGEPCLRCGRRLRATHDIDGRATTYCTRCQRAT